MVAAAEALVRAETLFHIAEQKRKVEPSRGWAIYHIDSSQSECLVASALGSGGKSSRVAVGLAEVVKVMAGSQCTLGAEVEGMTFPVVFDPEWV